MSQRTQTLFRLAVVVGLLILAARCFAQPTRAVQAANAKRVLAWSATQLGVRELTGRNDGPQVEAYLKVTGNRKGDSWCGAYQAAAQKACRLPFPNGAGGSYNWFKLPSRTYYVRGVRGSTDSLKAGHNVGFYYVNLKRVGHIARLVAPGRAVRKGRPARVWYTNEGNTGTGGGRDGAGVHQLTRTPSEFYAASNWLY